MTIFKDIRMEGVSYDVVECRSPWAFSVEPSEDAFLYVVRRGSGWLDVEALSEPLHVESGDLLAIASGERQVWRASPSTSPTTENTGVVLRPAADRTADDELEGSDLTRFLVGRVSRSANAVIPLLPPVIHVRKSETQFVERVNRFVALIEAESASDQLDVPSVVRRLSEILVIEFARLSLATRAAENPAWPAGLADTKFTRVLQLIHEHPEKQWTVGSLATEIGMSRSAFAEHFHRLVGTTPIRYLFEVRMSRATIELREKNDGLKTIAETVGYRSQVAFNKAFRREMGVTPGHYRRAYRYQKS